MLYGLSESDAGTISNNYVSYMSQNNVEVVSNLEVPVIIRSTILFAMAEPVKRGWISGDVYSCILGSMVTKWSY